MSFLTGIGNILVILHGTTARSSLRAPIIHGVLLYLAYVAVLAIYFHRLPVAPGVGLVLGVLCSGALELLLLLCVVALLLGAAMPTHTCAFDSLDGKQFPAGAPKRVEPGQSFVARGWLTGRDLQSPGPFTLVMRGSQVWGFAATTGMQRPDVAAALHAPSAGRAGFNLMIDAQTLPAGTYEVLGLVDQGHGAELCDMHRQLTIGAPAAP